MYDSTTGRSTFQFIEVKYSDAGQYQCQAVDETGTVLFESDIGVLTVQGLCVRGSLIMVLYIFTYRSTIF